MLLHNAKGRLGRGMAVLGLAGVVSIAVGMPANATSTADCTLYHVCMFKDVNYNNGIASYRQSDSDYRNNYFDGTPQLVGLNDNTSSIYNHNGSCNTNHYEHINYGGTYFSTLRSHYYPSIPLNDQLSSHKNIC